jgi:hypothetical protein
VPPVLLEWEGSGPAPVPLAVLGWRGGRRSGTWRRRRGDGLQARSWVQFKTEDKGMSSASVQWSASRVARSAGSSDDWVGVVEVNSVDGDD